MIKLEILALTARTASILLDKDDAKYNLRSPLSWRLCAQGETVQSGVSKTAGIFLSALSPNTAYSFECSDVQLEFVTSPCTGLVDATQFGLISSSKDNLAALTAAIEATPQGGTLSIPKGRYATRPLFLKSNMTLQLDKGAELSAVDDREGWPILPAYDPDGHVIGSWEGVPANCYAALLTAIGCEGLHITGEGVIDGGGDRGDWWQWPKETRNGARRARAIHLVGCSKVSIAGVHVKNAPSWTIHPFRCSGVSVSNVFITNPADSPNTDGLNPESCDNTSIIAVRFSVGDDCIAIKAGKRADDGSSDHLLPTTHLTISNCLMEDGHGAVVLGSEMSGSIVNVVVQNCEFVGTDRGIRIKTRRGRGGEIKDLSVRNISMVDVSAPITANAYYFCDHDGKSDWVQDREKREIDCSTPRISNIELSDIVAVGVEQVGIALLGLPEAPIENVSIQNFQIQFKKNQTPGVPLMALDVPQMCKTDIFVEHAQLNGQVVQLSGNCQQ